MFAAANMGKDLFARVPGLAEKAQITVIDSLCSTTLWICSGAGSETGGRSKALEEILTYLDDYFSRVETYFSVYNLDFCKKIRPS